MDGQDKERKRTRREAEVRSAQLPYSKFLDLRSPIQGHHGFSGQLADFTINWAKVSN